MHVKVVFAQLCEHKYGSCTEVELLPAARVDRTVAQASPLGHTARLIPCVAASLPAPPPGVMVFPTFRSWKLD